MYTKEQVVWYKVRCKWCKGQFVGNRVVPAKNEEPVRDYYANIKATNRSTFGQIQYCIAQDICRVTKISPVYVCDMRLLDKQIDYGTTHSQISIFDKEVVI